ncbi:MAG: HAD hydrolase-like protein [Eubacterium sp.]|nr:HAD hydrolase-like protein [Eubacterium sp.]
MKKYKTIIFDLDGTLLDTSEGIFKAIRYTEKQMGFTPLPDDRLPDFVGPPSLSSYLSHYPIDRDTALEAVKHHRYYQGHQGAAEATPYEGIPELLMSLKELGCHLGVATLKRQDITELTLKKAGIYDDFEAVCGIDAAESLTKADIIRLVLKKLDTAPSDAVMIGDSHFDAEGAKEAGVAFIGVSYGFGFKSPQEIRALRPRFAAAFVDDLFAFFDQEFSE